MVHRLARLARVGWSHPVGVLCERSGMSTSVSGVPRSGVVPGARPVARTWLLSRRETAVGHRGRSQASNGGELVMTGQISSATRSARRHPARAFHNELQGEFERSTGRFTHEVLRDTWSWSPGVYRILGSEPGEVVPTTDLFRAHVYADDVRTRRVASLTPPELAPRSVRTTAWRPRPASGGSVRRGLHNAPRRHRAGQGGAGPRAEATTGRPP